MAAKHLTRRPPAPAVDVAQYIATPADLACDVTAWLAATKRPDWRMVTFGHHALDADVALYPGSLTAVLGRPSMGKSMVCKWLAKRECQRIRDAGDETATVVYVTLEETAEVISMALAGWRLSVQDVVRGRFDATEWQRPALELAGLPVFMIRHPGVVDGKMPPALTPQRIYDAIKRIATEWPSDPKAPRLRPTLVILDYVQLLQGDELAMTESTKTAHVTAAIEGAKRLAVDLRVPVVMAVQAGRYTDNRADHMPTMGDAQWASAIEQACDVVLGVHRPIRRDDLADQIRAGAKLTVSINSRSYTVNDRLMIIGLVKQRAGVGAGRYPVYLDPVTLTLHAMEDDLPW